MAHNAGRRPSAAVNRHHPPLPIHPLPGPALAPPTTVQDISARFSKLRANHKKLAPRSSEPGPHPQPEPNFPTCRKDPTFSPAPDTSCTTTLTKSSSQKERASSFSTAMAAKIDVNEKMGSRKLCPDKGPKKDLTFIPSELVLRSLEKIEEVKRVEEGVNERWRRSSVSCIPPVVNGGRRRSFCSSQAELAGFLSGSGVRVVATDMPPLMQIHAVDCARKARDSLEKFTAKTLAFTLKKEFDGGYGPAWHCIVGTSFGSFVTHSMGGFMYFSMDHKLYILLFKTNVQRAEK
ncbi:Dynein light chain type 1 family protein [Striga hermonthica]|uniref:Dynein light chain type 1 family protein n=1 Tax=Striga hermonthica TaxID=68872 RepID=A0A9N7N5F9_STRHE|nr:Dynein light chain type 1 family protein [Striga hermonthica]